MSGNNPFSLAFLRGHVDVAKAVLDIAKAQYSPEEKDALRFRMHRKDDDTVGSMSEDESETDDDAEPQLVEQKVSKKFTIENIGQVSMQVKSNTRPLEIILWNTPSFKMDKGKATDLDTCQLSLFRIVLKRDDMAGLKRLLDLASHHASQKLEGDGDEPVGLFSFPEDEYLWAVMNGKTQALAEIIKRTGAGMPVDHLVKKSGVEVKDKPRFYQGLSVYGKKRYVVNSARTCREMRIADLFIERTGPTPAEIWWSSPPA